MLFLHDKVLVVLLGSRQDCANGGEERRKDEGLAQLCRATTQHATRDVPESLQECPLTMTLAEPREHGSGRLAKLEQREVGRGDGGEKDETLEQVDPSDGRAVCELCSGVRLRLCECVVRGGRGEVRLQSRG